MMILEGNVGEALKKRSHQGDRPTKGECLKGTKVRGKKSQKEQNGGSRQL